MVAEAVIPNPPTGATDQIVVDEHIHRGATREQQILVDRAFEEGIAEGIRMATELLERHGHKIGAQRLREAKIVNGEAAR